MNTTLVSPQPLGTGQAHFLLQLFYSPE